MELDSKAPSGPVETRWDRHRFNLKLVNPANKRKFSVIVVGTGLAGGAASATGSFLSGLLAYFLCRRLGRRAAVRLAGEKLYPSLEGVTVPDQPLGTVKE